MLGPGCPISCGLLSLKRATCHRAQNERFHLQVSDTDDTMGALTTGQRRRPSTDDTPAVGH